MKKTIASLAIALACAFGFAQSTSPFAVVQLASPKKLAEDVNAFMRAVTPDAPPQQQMMIAMVLGQFGYPFFDGIDASENAIVGFFDQGVKNASPIIVLAVKADPKTAVLCKNFDMQKIQSATNGGWYFANLSAPLAPEAFEKFLPSLIEAAKEKTSSSARILLYPDLVKFDLAETLNSMPAQPTMTDVDKKNIVDFVKALSKESKQIKSFEWDLNIDANKLSFESAMNAKSKTDLAEIFNTLPKRAKIKCLSAIDPNATMVIFGSMNSKRATDSIFKLLDPILKSFMNLPDAQIADMKNISKKSGETFAGSFDIAKDGTPTSISCTQTSSSFDEIFNYYKIFSSIKFKKFGTEDTALDQLNFSQKPFDLNGIKACELISSMNMSNQQTINTNYFYAIEKNLFFQTTSKEVLLKSIKNFAAGNSPLEKFAKSDNDATIIFNIEKLFALSGLNLAGEEINPLFAFVKLKKDSATFSTEIETKLIAKIVKIVEAVNAQKANAKQQINAAGAGMIQ